MSDRRRPGRDERSRRTDRTGAVGADGLGPDDPDAAGIDAEDPGPHDFAPDEHDSDEYAPNEYDDPDDYDPGEFVVTEFVADEFGDDVETGDSETGSDTGTDSDDPDGTDDSGGGRPSAGDRRRFGRGGFSLLRRNKSGRRTGGRGGGGRGRARPAISGMRLLVGTIGAVVVVIALFLVAYFTPLMSVRSVDVTGNSAVPAEEITSAAAIPTGEPLLQIDAAAAAQRVSMMPRIASVRVKREYPSTISISVVERVAVVYTEREGQKYLMDKLGFEFAQQDPPPGLAQLRTRNPGSGDASTRAALAVMAQVPPYVTEQIAAIEVSSPVNIVLVLKDNRTVVWGDDSRNAEKAETLRHVLTQPGTEYNVSSPSNPTFK